MLAMDVNDDACCLGKRVVLEPSRACSLLQGFGVCLQGILIVVRLAPTPTFASIPKCCRREHARDGR